MYLIIARYYTQRGYATV